MDRQYLELFKQLIRLKTTHDPENMSEHDRCRDLLKAEAEKHGLKTRLIPSDPYPKSRRPPFHYSILGVNLEAPKNFYILSRL